MMASSLYTIFVSLLLVCMGTCYIIRRGEILMDTLMDFRIAYNGTEFRHVSLSSDSIIVAGNATHGDLEQWVKVKVASNYKDTARFTFSYDKNNSLTLNIEYSFYEDPKSIPAVRSIALNLNVKKGSYESYLCQLPVTYTLATNDIELDDDSNGTATVSAVVSHSRFQAFGLVDESFGKGVECASDSKKHAPGDYSIKKVNASYACVNLSSSFSIDIDYGVKSTDSKKIAHILLPDGKVLNPKDCVNVDQPLLLSFYDDQFILNITFNRTDSKNYDVYVSHISLEYQVDDVLFPNASSNASHSLYLHTTDRLYTYTTGEYFKCLSNMKYKLSDDSRNTATLYTSEFRYIAFNPGKKRPTLYGRSYEQCPEDVKISNVVPIAVGAALGALVVIVLIAYLIGRRKTHKGYESV